MFIYREYKAYALFTQAWAREAAVIGSEGAARAQAAAEEATALFAAVGAGIKDSINTFLWHWQDEGAGVGWFAAWNRTTKSQIRNRTFQMAWPLWENLAANWSQVAAAVHAVTSADMLCPWGIASVSNADPRYNNDNIIKP